ncbi:hypothetical protein MN116_007986 [Schistosoma mekongi]|uniref:Uncharacterized protein n=1 Tax=Schistosoma mekongi TaxID=38744 RepID=A0AAE1Z8K5_SCHME|nr:hypothetical protein MN116_007986 [Schistosoma mekongi]
MHHKPGIAHNNLMPRRKHPKRCSLIVYHISTALLSIGILLTIIALATTRLFHIYIYDHRNPAKFHHVHIPVGLFSISTHVTWLSMEKSTLSYNLEISDLRWTLARTMSLIGLLTAIIALLVHLLLAYYQTNRKWLHILIEIVLLLITVTCILIGLSLAETEIEYIHDHGDMALTKLLVSNGLLGTTTQSTDEFSNGNQFLMNNNNNNYNQLIMNKDNTAGISSTDNNDVNNVDSTDIDRLGLTGEFALFLTPPLSSFFILISADFIYLLSFLSVLIYFVRLCEKASADRKQMKSAETTHA